MGLNICFSWNKISVKCTHKKNGFWTSETLEKTIIDNVSGSCNSGSLLAIMGSSGSGKTTLLGAISGRLLGKNGTLKLNNQIVCSETLRKLSAYIPQKYIFTENLTVFEHLEFMTALKTINRKMYSNTLLNEFLLDQETIISHLSGGEKRKLALATELISNPTIIFCDEITTGLDSFNAVAIVQKLLHLSHSGKIVILTVHQPSSQLYELFSHLMLLSNGQVVFQGTKEETRTFFAVQNLQCPISYNPADFYIKCLNDKNVKPIINMNDIPIENDKSFYELYPDDYVVPKKSFCFELKWLLWRAYIDNIKNINRYKVTYSISMITAFILGISYRNVMLEDNDSVQNIQGALLFAISELIFSHMYYVIFVFPSEMNIFLSEKHLYGGLPYFLSKLITTVPNCFANTLTYVLIYFIFLKFLNGILYFLAMLYVLFITTLSATTFGLCLSALFPTVEYMELFIIPLEVLVMTLSGIWIKLDTIPKFFGIIKYISPFYYSFKSISIMQWEPIDYIGGNCTTDTPCYETGADVLKEYGFGGRSEAYYNVLYLHILVILYSIIGYLCLQRKLKLFSMY